MQELKKTVILIGFMGCGKTTVGENLSASFKCDMIDTDEKIETAKKQPIADIFSKQGEESFRCLETKVLGEILNEAQEAQANAKASAKAEAKASAKANAKAEAFVISTGGGLPLREENRRLLKEIGTVIYLEANAETVFGRLKDDMTRPLLATPDPKKKISELLIMRKPFYEMAADITIKVDGKSIEEIVSLCRHAIKSFPTKKESE
ncbi:MAG: shikimate kinase [Lachnospiraceae bacterium]|nr:shikimate kinase [Lachnospiraceae bacterium]